MNINYSTNVSKLSDIEVAKLYESVGFGAAEQYLATDKLLDDLFGTNIFGIFATDAKLDDLVGMVRVFSDDRMVSWIAEICVKPTHQRKGVGSNLLGLVFKRFPHTAIYVSAFTDQQYFFETNGLIAKSKLVSCSKPPGNESRLN